MNLPDIRKKYFGFVFQAFNLFPSLTAIENVELVLRLKKTPNPLSGRRQPSFSKGRLGRRSVFYPSDLSGGENSGSPFARALAGDPPILLADEPTANLDSKTVWRC